MAETKNTVCISENFKTYVESQDPSFYMDEKADHVSPWKDCFVFIMLSNVLTTDVISRSSTFTQQHMSNFIQSVLLLIIILVMMGIF